MSEEQKEQQSVEEMLAQDYNPSTEEEIKRPPLVPAGTICNCLVLNAELQASNNQGLALNLSMKVEDENEWFDRPLYYNLPIGGVQLKSFKASWEKVMVRKGDSWEKVKIKALKVLSGLTGMEVGNIADALGLDALEEKQQKGKVQQALYERYVHMQIGEIPTASGYVDAIEKKDLVFAALGIDKLQPKTSIEALAGKKVRLVIGEHNEFPKGKFNQVVQTVELKRE